VGKNPHLRRRYRQQAADGVAGDSSERCTMTDRHQDRDRKEEVGSAREGEVKELAGKEVTEPDAEEVKGGKVSHTDISFTKKVDKSSPLL
jgi:hypothetical protein